MIKHIIALGAGIALLAHFSSAGLVTAYEEIVDPVPFEVFDRDLTRTRSSDGFFEVETDDATIIAENSINSSFGILDFGTVSYEHNLSWLAPAAASFINARLTISAWGAVGNNDAVFLENVSFVGMLPNGFGSGTAGFSAFTMYSDNNAALDVIFGDGLLMVDIDKNVGAPSWLFDPTGQGFNALSVYGSKLEVSYMTAAIPEPSSLLMLGTLSTLGLVFLRRRRKA